MYPSPINEIEEIKSYFNGKLFPSAKKIADGLLTIPTHQFLSKKDKEKICGLLNSVVISKPQQNIKRSVIENPKLIV